MPEAVGERTGAGVGVAALGFAGFAGFAVGVGATGVSNEAAI